jgi:hypothetical protein
VSEPEPAAADRTRLASPWFLGCLAVLSVAAGCATMLLTRQDHSAEARIVCERFVRHRLPPGGVRFSGEKVQNLSATRHVVTGTARVPGRPAQAYTCAVSHAGNRWALDGMTGV